MTMVFLVLQLTHRDFPGLEYSRPVKTMKGTFIPENRNLIKPSSPILRKGHQYLSPRKPL